MFGSCGSDFSDLFHETLSLGSWAWQVYGRALGKILSESEGAWAKKSEMFYICMGKSIGRSWEMYEKFENPLEMKENESVLLCFVGNIIEPNGEFSGKPSLISSTGGPGVYQKPATSCNWHIGNSSFRKKPKLMLWYMSEMYMIRGHFYVTAPKATCFNIFSFSKGNPRDSRSNYSWIRPHFCWDFPAEKRWMNWGCPTPQRALPFATPGRFPGPFMPRRDEMVALTPGTSWGNESQKGTQGAAASMLQVLVVELAVFQFMKVAHHRIMGRTYIFDHLRSTKKKKE